MSPKGHRLGAWTSRPCQPSRARCPKSVEKQYGTGSCEAENALDDGTYYEKTILQFSTAEDIRAIKIDNPYRHDVVQDSTGGRLGNEAEAAGVKSKGGLTSTTPLVFVIMDAQENYYLIGAREAPYPIIEISKSVSTESNVNNVKVTFSKRKSLIPCPI